MAGRARVLAGGRFVLAHLLGLLKTSWLERLLVEVIAARARSLPPAEALRFLFRLDERLYPLQGEMAVAYGGGVHTKHRHIHYHDFFVSRVHPGEQVLDIGCGLGAVAYDLAAQAGAGVVGIDLSADNIAVARARYAHPHVRYLLGDALKELPDERFDVVILSNVLEHLPERSAFLRHIQGIAHPSRILIRVPLLERHWSVPLKLELGVEWRLDHTHETEYTLESFAQEMAEAGLTVSYHEVRWGEIWAEVVPHAT